MLSSTLKSPFSLNSTITDELDETESSSRHLELAQITLKMQTPVFTLYKSAELEVYIHSMDEMSKELKNRFIRCTIDNMNTACNNLNAARAPQRQELIEMAKLLVKQYPGLADKHPTAENKTYVSINL